MSKLEGRIRPIVFFNPNVMISVTVIDSTFNKAFFLSNELLLARPETKRAAGPVRQTGLLNLETNLKKELSLAVRFFNETLNI